MDYVGPGFSVSLPFAEIADQLERVGASLQEEAPSILRAMGVMAAGFAVSDYRDRSEGQAAGGIAWKPITDSAIRTRLAARKPWQNQRAELAALRAEEAPILEAIRKRLPRNNAETKSGKTLPPEIRKKQRGKLSQVDEAQAAALQSIRERRDKVRAARKALFEKEKASAKIGVDTGRLVNSLVYGVPELQEVAALAPRLAPGAGEVAKATFRVDGFSIVIGSNMEYAGYFDALRPLIGEGFISPDRLKMLEGLALEYVQSVIDDRLSGGRVA